MSITPEQAREIARQRSAEGLTAEQRQEVDRLETHISERLIDLFTEHPHYVGGYWT